MPPAIDPVNNEADYEELLGAIQRMRRGRLYYNPLRHRGASVEPQSCIPMYTQLQTRDSARPPVTLATLRQDARRAARRSPA